MNYKTFLVVARSKQRASTITKTFLKEGFKLVTENPDFIISFGGDGTYLGAEREYLGIPKLLVRDSKICVLCNNAGLPYMLKRLKSGKVTMQTFLQLHVQVQGQHLLAVNEVVVRNTLPTHALRFLVRKNGKLLPEEFIGDGIIAATSFGATGYYYSATRNKFTTGFSLGFNNVTKPQKPVHFTKDDRLEVELVRSHAIISADNNPKVLYAHPPEVIFLQASDLEAKIITLKKLRVIQ